MNELLAAGFQLMGVGMGVVFLFLGLLVAVISLVSRLIQYFEAKTAAAVSSATGNDEDLIEVVTEAVKRYRADHHR